MIFLNLFFLFGYILLAFRAVLPWIPHRHTDRWAAPVYALTDPLLNPIRLGLPPEKIGFDVSPFAGIVLLYLLQSFITNLAGGN